MSANILSLWHYIIEPGSKIQGFRLDGLSLYWKVKEGDWIVGSVRQKFEGETSEFEMLESEAPEDVSWRRLASVDDVPAINVLPAYPNRAVVVRPEYPYNLLPGERVNIFVGVPVSVTLQSPKGILLMEEPVHPLSSTWFGSPTDGELCFGMRTLARREGENLDFGPARVICPVRIRNQSKEKISFERLCLRVQYLNIYENGHRRLWANESSVMVRGDESWSRLAFASKAPAYVKNPKLLVHGKEDARGTFLIRALNEGKGFFQ
ncbi:hypothetical protein P0Y35_13960 [Kiritimatiellaeota bacterium B1221]|nr:hypothetical protein [Kiritimatiellaeota bacterium B1221]